MAPLLLRITLPLLLLVTSASGVVQRSGTFDTNGNTLAPTNYVITGTLSNIGAVNHAAPETNWAAVVNKSTLSTLGNVDIAGSMFVTSAFNLGGIATLSNNLAVALNAGITGTLGVGGQTALSNGLSVAGSANVTGAMGVGGAATLSNNLVVAGNANITGASGHGGVATFSNSIVGQGAANITGALSAGGSATLSNGVTVTGAAAISGNLSVNDGQNVLFSDGTVDMKGGAVKVAAGGGGTVGNIVLYDDGNVRFAGGITNNFNTNAGAQHVAGPAVNYAGVTNRSTVRVMGGQTNDSNLQVTGALVAQSTANITGVAGVGGILTASNTIVAQAGVNVTGTLNANAIINTNLATFMGGAVVTNNATTNVPMKIVGMSALTTNIWEVWSNGVLQVTVSSNGIITFPSSNPVQVYRDSTDSLQLVAALGSGKIVYVGDATAASYGVAVGSSATRIKSGVLALGGANDTNNIRLKQIQAGTTTLPNVLGIQDAAGGAAGCLIEFRAVPDSRTNNVPSTDSARIGAFLDVSGVAQLFVKAEDGTTKQITEHAIADCPPFLLDAVDDMPNVSKEIQPYLGKVRWINRSREALLTQMQFWGTNVNAMPTNKTTFIYVETFQRYNNRLNLTNGNALVIESWTNNQAFQQSRYDAARLDEQAQLDAGNTNITVRPVRDIRKPIPAWLSARGAQ
jgi:hypothetical protein